MPKPKRFEKNIFLPFNPFPFRIAKALGKPFVGIGSVFTASKTFKLEIIQSDLRISSEEYGSITVVVCLFYFLLMSLVSFIFIDWLGRNYTLNLEPESAIFLAPIIGALFAFLIFMQLILYPKIQVMRKIKDIDRNLVFALRTILIQIKSGVTLYDALKVIADGDYGILSEEFKKAVLEIGTGVPQEDALDSLSVNNPSLYFRRTLWQIVNGMRAGADISVVLSESVDSLTTEQGIEIRRYGNQLRLLSLMYMMLGVIMPALGITFLIVLSSFPQIQVSEYMFWGLMAIVVLSQFMFLGIVKNKRPNLLGD